jgi:ABC-type nitrate/sulfonate/bicarbonate transport system permease component
MAEQKPPDSPDPKPVTPEAKPGTPEAKPTPAAAKPVEEAKPPVAATKPAATAKPGAPAKAKVEQERPGKPRPEDAEDEQDEETQRSVGGFFRGFFKIRDEPGLLGRLVMGALCIGLVFFAWWWATRGPVDKRIIGPGTLDSPAETFRSFKSLWFERALTRNTMASLKRVIEGYGIALLVGIPLGVLAGCFRRISAFLAPLTVFFRNVPVAALLPLTMLFFGVDELQKVLFLFIACVAFVISDATERIASVDQKYLDTAYTLGASRLQVIFKVLIPLALPGLFNSMRLLFGLAFGYIIMVETVNMDNGLGTLIMMSQRRGPKEHVILCLFVITLVAYLLDRVLAWIGKALFPYRARENS